MTGAVSGLYHHSLLCLPLPPPFAIDAPTLPPTISHLHALAAPSMPDPYTHTHTNYLPYTYPKPTLYLPYTHTHSILYTYPTPTLYRPFTYPKPTLYVLLTFVTCVHKHPH